MSEINPKNQLQERCQAFGESLPVYEHEKDETTMKWRSVVKACGLSIAGDFCQKKTHADKLAAQKLLEVLEKQMPFTCKSRQSPNSISMNALKLNKYQPFQLLSCDLDRPQTTEIVVLIDFENINSLEHLHNLWSYQGKIIPVLKFVGQSNSNSETGLSTHVTCSGKDAVDHFMSTFIGYHMVKGNLKKVLILTRDNFGKHHTDYYSDVPNAPEFHWCTSERLCIKRLNEYGCTKTDTITEYLHDLNNPTSWEYLKHYDDQVIYHPFARHPEVQKQYQIAKEEKLAMKNHIASIKETIKERFFSLNRNDYPYHLPHNVCHYVYWHNGTHTRDDARTNISGLITGTSPDDVVVFTNAPEVQTIPHVPHHHVFIRY